MNSKNPPAFPVPINKINFDTHPRDFETENCSGMSLRDWFAGMAINGMFATPNLKIDGSNKIKMNDMVNVAYNVADAMLTERSK